MRLLIVSQYFWPENFRINDLAAELVQRGHQVTVLTGVPNYPDGNIFPQFQENPHNFSKYKGVGIIRVQMTVRGRGNFRLLLNYFTFALSGSVFGPLKLRGNKFDAIFTCQLSPVTVGLPAAVMRAIKRVPMVLWVLDLWPDTLQAVGIVRSRRIIQLTGWLIKFIYSRCDLILAQSKSFIPQIKKHTLSNKRVEYFPSWAEKIFDLQQNIWAEEVPKIPQGFSVMFAGNIGEAQDFPAILDAAENLRAHTNIRWLIVGDGRNANWVEDQIKRRRLDGCVFMFGRHPVDKMPSFFRHADALLVSLKDEPIFSMTIPGKLQSYLVSGIPIVAMMNGEGAALVKNSNSGLVCNAGDSAGLAVSVLKLSKMSKEERNAMGKNGQEVSTKEFDRSMLVDKLEGWFAEVVSLRKFKP